MTTFKNNVTLRGFLGRDVEEAAGSAEIDSFAVLLLATASGAWDVAANEWRPRTDWHRVICPGPYFRGFTRGMRQGDYLEIEGELRARDAAAGGDAYAVHATAIRRLDRLDWVVLTGEEP